MPDSWWLKVKRAQKHMIDIREIARAYAKTEPYDIIRIQPSKQQPKVWRYRLAFAKQPDPMLGIVLGDFIHNLRSALDHIFFACCEKKSRSNATLFPIAVFDPWRRDSDGSFVDNKRRVSFEAALKGLSRKAITTVIALQPYQHADAFSQALGVLSRLENADKHRKLITVASNLRNPTLKVLVNGVTHPNQLQSTRWQFFHDNAEVVKFTVANPQLKESDVHVECHGTTMISIKGTDIRNNARLDFPLQQAMLKIIWQVRLALRQMELNVLEP